MHPLVGSLSASQTSARGIARAIFDHALLSFPRDFFSLPRGCLFLFRAVSLFRAILSSSAQFRLPHNFVLFRAILSFRALLSFAPPCHLSRYLISPLPRNFRTNFFRAPSAQLPSAPFLSDVRACLPQHFCSHFCALALRAFSLLCFGFCSHCVALFCPSPRRTLLYLSPAPWLIRILLAPLLPFFRIQSSQPPSPMLTLWRSPFLTR